MPQPTSEQIELLQAIDIHKLGPFPTIPKEELGKCIDQGWLVTTANGYALTAAGRSVLEAHR